MKEQQNEGRTFIDQEYKDAAGNPPFRNLSAGDDAEEAFGKDVSCRWLEVIAEAGSTSLQNIE